MFGCICTSGGDDVIEDDIDIEEYSFLPEDMDICRDVFERYRVMFDLPSTSTIEHECPKTGTTR